MGKPFLSVYLRIDNSLQINTIIKGMIYAYNVFINHAVRF